MDERPAGTLDRPHPIVRRLLAPNPSPFTYTGTNSFIVGEGEVAVIDPGPDIPAHIDALLAATAGERVAAILCTHTHRDHSPASAPLAQATGAPIIGCAPLRLEEAGVVLDGGLDADYAPDRVLADGERLEGLGWTLSAVATPGHAANHLCFALEGAGILFSGDHVMGWATSVVSPPEGDMGDYMRSLERLLERNDSTYFPAHGLAVEAPRERVQFLIAHRRERERQILELVSAGEATISAMVPIMYREVNAGLYPAAERSVLAHLIDLRRRGIIVGDGERWRIAA